jgi:hypothetical protein
MAMATNGNAPARPWPALPYAEWKDTLDTLHMFTQVVGKVRLALAPDEPQWAQVPLYVTARGLSTSMMPWDDTALDIEFDFIDHDLVVRTSPGEVVRIALAGHSVAEFYREVMAALEKLGVNVSIWPVPVEIPDPIPFEKDERNSYDASAVARFFDALTRVTRVMHEHRSEYRGRTSAVHFFWGTFDLANARYSGETAAPPPGADSITLRSYDVEQITCGWWPGDARFEEPAFYAYAYPQPARIERATIAPANAFWSGEAGLFLLRYDDARAASDPGAVLREFFDSTYTACASLLGWSPGLVQRNR